MRILHVITTIDIGGAEKQLLELCRSQIKSKHVVKVAYLKGPSSLENEFQESKVLIDSTVRSSNLLMQPRVLRRLIKEFDPEIVHFHLPRAELMGALARYPKRYMISRHNTESFIPQGPEKLSRFLSKAVTRRAYSVVAISETVKDFLTSIDEISKKTRVTTIEYGVNLDVPAGTFKKPRGKKLVFGTLSRLSPQKNVPCLLQGFALHLEEHNEDSLKIAGTGELASELYQLTSNLGIKEKVEWMGKVSDADSFLKSIDVFVLASNYEGFGLVILESLQARVTLLCSKSLAALEILGSDYAGLFDLGDSKDLSTLMEKAHNPVFRNRLQSQGEKVLARYSIEVTREKHDRLYSMFMDESLSKRNEV